VREKGLLIVISVLVGFYNANQLTAWLFVFLIWLVLLLIWLKHQHVTLLEMVILLAVTLFFSFHFIEENPDLSEQVDQELQLRGKVTEVTSQTDDYSIFTILANDSKQAYQVTAFTPLNHPIKVGASCDIKGVLQLPTQSTNPGQFNYQSYLSDQGVHYQLVVNDENDVYCQGANLAGKLEGLREKQLHNVTEQFSDHTAIWIKSLIFGERDDLPMEIEQLFQRWHLTHLLAISGLHINIIVFILYFLLIYIFRLTKESTYQLLIGFILFYPFMAGGAPSVWRAAIVSILNYLAWYQRNRYATIDFLSLSFLLLLFLNPNWIYSLGFQFSYIISFAILLSQKILRQIKSQLLKLLFISGLSLLIILPIQINAFYQFNPLSLIVNLFATTYFSALFIPLVFFTYLSGLICPFISSILDIFMQWANHLFLFILNVVDRALYFPIIIGQLSPIIIVLFYMSLFYLLIQLERKEFKKMIQGFICLGLIFFTQQIGPYLNPFGKITILDLGQANTMVIELPYKKAVIMYDIGATLGADFQAESDRAYQQIIKPFLHYSGINKIDAIILSHEDYDHSGSLPYLIADFPVKTVITSEYYTWSDSAEKMLNSASVEHQSITAGQTFTIGDHIFYALSPIKDWQDKNDNSLVIYTQFSDQAWLLTGDISAQVEQDIVKHYPTLKINTLLVAHHGSMTSTNEAFLKRIAPEQAIIPVGRNNRFNHPSDLVLSRLKERDIVIYRTDQNGAIQYIYHKNKEGGTFSLTIP